MIYNIDKMTSNFRNYYTLLPKKFQSKIDSYKSYPRIKIKTPMRMLIVGTSGSMKTNALMNIISNINNFTMIFIYAKEINEPLYANLIDIYQHIGRKFDREIVTFSNSIKDVPPIEQFDKREKNLVIFDDLVNETSKNLKNISDLFCMGRKRNISTIFISQSYFKVPMIIRQNVNYVMLKKISGKRDLNRILGTMGISENVSDILEMYRWVQKQNEADVFLIDGITNDLRLRFRINFDPIVS